MMIEITAQTTPEEMHALPSNIAIITIACDSNEAAVRAIPAYIFRVRIITDIDIKILFALPQHIRIVWIDLEVTVNVVCELPQYISIICIGPRTKEEVIRVIPQHILTVGICSTGNEAQIRALPPHILHGGFINGINENLARLLSERVSTISIPFNMSKDILRVLAKNVSTLNVVSDSEKNIISVVLVIPTHILYVNFFQKFRGKMEIDVPRQNILIVKTFIDAERQSSVTAYITLGINEKAVHAISRHIVKVHVCAGVGENIVRAIPPHVSTIYANEKIDKNVKKIIDSHHKTAQASQALKKGNYQEAIELASTAIEIDDKAVNAYDIRAICYANISEFYLAIKDKQQVSLLKTGSSVLNLKQWAIFSILQGHKNIESLGLPNLIDVVLPKFQANLRTLHSLLMEDNLTPNMIKMLRIKHNCCPFFPDIFEFIITEERKQWEITSKKHCLSIDAEDNDDRGAKRLSISR